MNWIKFVNFFSPARSEIAENGADKVLSSEEKNFSVHKAYVNFPTSRKSALDVLKRCSNINSTGRRKRLTCF